MLLKRCTNAILDQHKLDALVAPASSPPWSIDLVNGDHFLFGSTTPAAVAGYASISVPCGYAFGLPMGLSFIGRRFGEGALLKLAYAFEQATRHRRPPGFAASAELGQR